jgi:RimJ/RimL family protein N-acetyltransferase
MTGDRISHGKYEESEMRVEGERIFLRPLRDEDCTESYLGWLNDPEVSRFLETRHIEQSIARIREFVTTINERVNEHLFGIFLHMGGRHIGNIKAGPIHPYHGYADVSLFIGAKDCWRKGYATEAITVLSRHAFANLGVRKLVASMYEPNQGSYCAFIKAGYKDEGRLRAHYLLEGRRCDLLVLGLCVEDLQ